MKIIVHRPAQGLEGRSATRLRDIYASTVARAPDGVELDVRVTADGVPIVAHDPTARTGLVARRPISTLRYADFADDTFLPLDALMPVFADFAGRVYVEIKDVSEAAVARTLEVLEPFRRQVWFLSLPWKHTALRNVLARWPEARTNQIVIHPALAHVGRALDIGVGAMAFGWSGINTFRMLEPVGGRVRRFVDAAMASGIEVSAGLANSTRDLAWAARTGFEMVWVDPHMLDQARALSRRAMGGT